MGAPFGQYHDSWLQPQPVTHSSFNSLFRTLLKVVSWI
jgi:hypothetical protein